MFKKLIVFLIVSLCLTSVAEGKVKDFRLKNLDNKRVSYSKLKGDKVTVIDFWATWCVPCRRSIPKLVAIHERYREKGVRFIGISVDGPRNLPKVKPHARSLGITYPVVIDINSQIMKELKVISLPTVLLIDQNDEIVYIHRGYRPGDEEILEKEIQKLLEKSGSESNED
ncbi:MAG: TlpA family protein disulfide reductase [bacterium]|nr:MAG: TlpA family protein disulfide reductase [bacterium]